MRDSIYNSMNKNSIATKQGNLMKRVAQNKFIYLILLPGILYYIIFAYFPMYGVSLAFKEYFASKGILGSPFVGLVNFKYVFTDSYFWKACYNTIFISFGRIIFQFPFPIILAIMLNEVSNGRYKKTLQTIYTLPHFLSWVIVSGIILNICDFNGPINHLIELFGGDKQTFLSSKGIFIPLLFISDSWKESGWSSIIYLAAIASINNEIYEAAEIDGANRLKKMLHVTWPGIKPTVIVMLLLSIGGMMNGGFDQIFNMYNPAVQSVSDIIDTYIYRITFQMGSDFGFSTAVGLFKSVINFVLLVAFDKLARALGENGIFG